MAQTDDFPVPLQRPNAGVTLTSYWVYNPSKPIQAEVLGWACKSFEVIWTENLPSEQIALVQLTRSMRPSNKSLEHITAIYTK